MEERPFPVDRHGFKHDPVVPGAERALSRVQHQPEIVGSLGGDAVVELHLVRRLQRLVEFPADVYPEPGLRCGTRSAASLDVQVQDQDVAPALRPVERCAHCRKRIADQRVDVATELVRGLRRLQVKRSVERALVEIRAQRGVLRVERCG